MLKEKINIEKIILVGVDIYSTQDNFEALLDETIELVKAANGKVVATVTQKREALHRANVIGFGKLDEILAIIEETQADAILFNTELSGTQLRNLERILNVKVIDRTMLILDIFANRAIGSEGKLQVSLAQNQYRLSRLVHHSPYLSRLGGGIGTRGPGETKLESDRRHIQREISSLKKKLKSLSAHREQTRIKRKQSHLPTVVLLGYTNAGKSSILNAILKKSKSQRTVEAKDMLFASLQPFTRRIETIDVTFLMSDTVGFISNLPTHLIAAFESTLKEVEEADVLIHVIDASSPQMDQQIESVRIILEDFDLSDKVTISYFNKIDLIESNTINQISLDDITMMGSAHNPNDMNQLFDVLNDVIQKI